eukprot:TRINITY_DN63824_c0_g1_i1.p1 TRINITY_DN63824_c0_g1~~TRINITY_DN63824_c0_g1_i1.p1  ORF type:complete len:465 (+),score=87.66 TRINITY_DN63824_c0_g1_i1:102-1496(+)
MRLSLRRLVRYQHGAYGGFFHSEALAGALPRRQNTPQRPAYGLYPELLSGTAFTQPRHQNHYSWLYRVRPSVQHSPKRSSAYALWEHPAWVSPPLRHAFPPVQYRFRPAPAPAAASGTDFLDGTVTVAVNGSPEAQDGAAANVYGLTASMADRGRVMRNADADTLILPQEGQLVVRTEFGDLEVEPCEMVLVPRGTVFQVNLADKTELARGYYLENFGSQFVIPDLGPIGISGGLAHPRHFLAPEARYEDSKQEGELVSKFCGRLYRSPISHSPFDVVAWYGNYVPCKYDLRLFMAINTVTYDHPDPSIGCVMSSYTAAPGRANIDFVIFPPRYMVGENTFRPPWYHRNDMSEFMGLLHGSYDAKPDGFKKGACSIHNRFTPHGPDAEAVRQGTELDSLRPHRMENTMAFMWESNKIWHPTEFALSNLDDVDYASCWDKVESRFDPAAAPSPGGDGYAFDGKYR